MATNRVGDMTLDELNELIDQRIKHSLQPLLKRQNRRSTSELLSFLDEHRITLPPGAKSALEMLREDRDT